MVRRATAVSLVILLLLGSAPAIGHAQAPPPPGAPVAAAAPSADSIGATPPRLAYAQGPVSFWRPGAADWAPAQVNTPLVPGDELYTGHEGLLELQVGGRAYVRAWGDTQLGLPNQEPDFLQLKITTGHATLDLRTVEPGRSVEIDTPHAAFAIDSPGYYRVDVTPERTSFVTRRAGRAAMTPAGGRPMAIAPSEEVVVEGGDARSFAARDLDVFDRWNYARTDELLESVSARYIPPQVYGADDLDHYGAWRQVPTYGAIWVPQAVPVGWAPYSSGRWVADPIYGWTWVDTAPWGWAPYHYGRWVFVDSYWAWAPGPIVARPVYAPALVAFFGAPGVSVSVGLPFVSWVALGWGEPVVPWWGRPGYIGRPHWAGWGGPRVVNNVVVNKTTVVNVTNINVYRNTTVNNAVVAVRRDGFGRTAVNEARVENVDVRHMRPVHGRLDVQPTPASFVASSGAAPVRPSETTLTRQVVATRPPARHSRESLPPAAREGTAAATPAPVSVPAPKIVPAPKAAQTAPVPARPPLGASDVERGRRSEPQRLEATPQPPQGGAAPAAVTPRDDQKRDEPRGRGENRGRETPRGRGPEHAAPPSTTPPAATAPSIVTPPQTAPSGRPQTATPPSARAPQAVQPAPPVARPLPEPARPQPQSPPARQQPQQQQDPTQGGRPLPGEPANRVFPGRSEIRPRPEAAPTHESTASAMRRGAAPAPAISRQPPAPAAARQSMPPVPAVNREATTPAPQRGGFSAERRNPQAATPVHAAPATQHKTGDDGHDARKGLQR